MRRELVNYINHERYVGDKKAVRKTTRKNASMKRKSTTMAAEITKVVNSRAADVLLEESNGIIGPADLISSETEQQNTVGLEEQT